MEYIVWVGPRDADIKFCKCFSDRITYYSKNNPCPCRKAHIYGKSYIEFIQNKMEQILCEHPNAKFIFYNPKIAYALKDTLRKNIICLNEKYILDLLSDKIYTRFWLGNYVPVLPSILMDSKQLSFSALEEKLCKADSYVLQLNRSSGGFGTFYVTPNNQQLSILKEKYKELFIISPYIKNGISVNINAIIYNENILIFQPSIQIVEHNKNRLLYHGADYVAAQSLDNELKKEINSYSQKILELIQALGYRGIIGIDYIIDNHDIYFQEINPRYQASTFLLDIALQRMNLPSVSQLNLQAFENNVITNTSLVDLTIDYSFYKYLYTKNTKHLYHVAKIAQNNSFVEYTLFDGWNSQMLSEEDAYCYTVVFSSNITSLNLDGGYNLYSNITGEESYLKNNLNTKLGLKIALLNQGCVIDEPTIQYLKSEGIIKKAVFSAIDFQMSDGVQINAPINLKFTDFSPFIISINKNFKIELNYYDELISEINIEMQPTWNSLITKNNVPYGRIAYLSTDRLRIKHETVCSFKKKGTGCTFCGIPATMQEFNYEDIKEVIETLLKVPTFRHILIGGGSGNPDNEFKQIIPIIHLIRKINPEIPLYLMSLPPTDSMVLKLYKEAGINEVAFNIEIWNREIALKLMPGKGQITLAHYLHILKEGTKLWGTNGNVRTALIVGLNDTNSLIAGITTLCQNGIQPMLSVFRPMLNTKLESLVPPSNDYLLDIYNKAKLICSKYNMELGPTCNECKNNMLAI